MKLGIISVEKQWEIERIMSEAKKKGDEISFNAPDDFQLELPFRSSLDAVYFRAIIGKADYSKTVASILYSAGVAVVDERLAKEGGRNKFMNYALLLKSGIKIPPTKQFIPNSNYFESEYLVVKPLHGKRGQGLRKIKAEELSKLKLEGEFIVQPFLNIEHEYRVLVIGGEVIGAFEKRSNTWIRNISQGAEAVAVEVNEEMKEVAIKACKVLNTEIGGVDIAYSKSIPYVFEVNRSPGFKAFEASTKINVALKIVEYLHNKAKK